MPRCGSSAATSSSSTTTRRCTRGPLSRTGRSPERKRVLWRLWLRIPDFRPATPYSAQWAKGVRLERTQQQIRLVYGG